jgi:hypothetical protein
MRFTIFSSFVVLLCLARSAVGDDAEVDAVKKAVLGPQEAGWGRHDLKTYMTQWTDDARIIAGRAEQPGKFDFNLDRKQIEATRRLHFHGKPPEKRKITFANVKVTVKDEEAELRCRSTLANEDEQYVSDEIYRLRKTPAGWKVYLNRGWFVSNKFKDQSTTYDAETWKKLDQEVEDLRGTDKRGDKVGMALLNACRAAEAYDILKKVTARKDVTANDWLPFGYAAFLAGRADESVAAFKKALELDPDLPVPPFARPAPKE